MKIFGISIWLILMLVGAMWFGARNPQLVDKIPVLNAI